MMGLNVLQEVGITYSLQFNESSLACPTLAVTL